MVSKQYRIGLCQLSCHFNIKGDVCSFLTIRKKAGSNAVIETRWIYYDNETNSWAYASDTSDSGFSITGSESIMPGLIIRPDIDLSVFKIFPSVPTSLTVSPYMFSRLDLFWKDNSHNETGFVIERKVKNGSYAQIATVGTDITKYSDTDAVLDTTYYYRVKATGELDSGYSNEASGTLLKVALKPNIDLLERIIAIKPPSNLKANSVSGDPNGVNLSWKASDSDIDGYIIERKSGTGDWEMTSSAGTDETNVTETGLKTNTIYSYRVKAYKLYMNSDPSNIIEFNTAAEKPVINGQISLDFFIDNNTYKINDISSILDVSPVIKEGRTLIPIRYVTTPFGAEIQWIDEEKKVTITQGTTIIELWIGKNMAKINGESVPIDPGNSTVIPLIINGRTMMPLRFIAENLGCEVKWISEYKQVKIIYQGNKLDPQPEPPIN